MMQTDHDRSRPLHDTPNDCVVIATSPSTTAATVYGVKDAGQKDWIVALHAEPIQIHEWNVWSSYVDVRAGNSVIMPNLYLTSHPTPGLAGLVHAVVAQ